MAERQTMVAQNDFDSIFEAAMKLTVAERIALAERIYLSLEKDEDLKFADEWQAEIDRRLEEARRDPSILIDGDELLAKLRRGECP